MSSPKPTGRPLEAADVRPPADDEFLTGHSGSPGGASARLLRRAGDLALDGRVALSGAARRLDGAAAEMPRRDVQILSVYRPPAARLRRALDELGKTRHATRVTLGSMGAPDPALAEQTIATELRGGKFENLNALLDAGGGEPADWTLAIDDDVVLPARFLDRFLAVCERMDLALAQPAQSLRSFAAWPITRRRPGLLARETRFVEIGPVTCFRRDSLAELAPFAPLRYGWGLDLHWAALAADRGWRLGVVDALPVRHEHAAVGASYSTTQAIEEARSFLAERPFVRSAEAQQVVRSLPLSAPLP